jgi:hypothetical protein
MFLVNFGVLVFSRSLGENDDLFVELQRSGKTSKTLEFLPQHPTSFLRAG